MLDDRHNISKVFFIAASIIVIWLSILIIKPFIIIILTSIIISYIAYPLYKLIHRKVRFKSLSSLIVCITLLLIIIGPMLLIFNTLWVEAQVNEVSIKLMLKHISEGEVFNVECNGQPTTLCSLSQRITYFTTNPQITFYFQTVAEKFSDFVVEKVSGFIFSLPMVILKFFIMIFLMYYLLKDGRRIFNLILNILPIEKSHRLKVVNKFKDVTYAVFYGQILVAIIQGLLGGIGFWAVGIPSPILWGVIMAFFALLPFMGTAVIWLPACIFFFINSLGSSDNVQLFVTIAFFLYNLFIVSGIDNLIRPKLVGDRANVHPMLVLMGVLGGLYLFGFVGIFIGPIILALTVTFIQIYDEEKILLRD